MKNSHSYAQSTFISMEQKKYAHTENGMVFRGATRINAEIEFHIKKKYIIIRDTDADTEALYVNVIQAPQENSWQAHFVKAKKNYLFTVIMDGKKRYIIVDDGTFATYFIVYDAKSNSD